MTDPKGRGKTCEPDVKAIVERLKAHDLNICPDWKDAADLRDWVDTADALILESAALILQITAERDAAERKLDNSYAYQKVQAGVRDELRDRADAAEKRAKELETALNNDKDEGLWRFWNHKALDLAASNKLLSERVAVLEKENERKQRTLDFVICKVWQDDPPNASVKLTDAERLSIVKYHPCIKGPWDISLRRARTAMEGK